MPKPVPRYPTIEVEAGGVVYRRHDAGDCMYLVQEGSVELLDTNGDGALAVFERGDFFGEMAILGDPERTHTVRAAEPTRLVKIDGRGFSHLLARNPEITIRMIRKLSRRIAGTEERVFRAWSGIPLDADATASRTPHRAWLVPLDGGGPAIPVPGGQEVRIGRTDPVNDVVPDIDLSPLDPTLSTSRRHAVLRRTATAMVLEEVRSTNGTFVDGRRLSAGRPVALAGGEELRFGGVRFTVTFEAPENQDAVGAVGSDVPPTPGGDPR